MDDHTERIRELFRRARELEQEAEGLRAEAGRLIRELSRTAAGSGLDFSSLSGETAVPPPDIALALF